MKKNILKSMLILIGILNIVVLLIGCAPAPIDLLYHSHATVPNAKPSKTGKLYVLQARDLRNAAPDQIATIKYVGYTKYGEVVSFVTYKARQSLADVVTSELKETLNNMYVLTDDGHAATLSTNIMELSYEHKGGLFKHALAVDLLLQFKLMDAGQHKILWAKTLRGHSKLETYGSITRDDIKKVFVEAADNVFVQLMNDADFKQAM